MPDRELWLVLIVIVLLRQSFTLDFSCVNEKFVCRYFESNKIPRKLHILLNGFMKQKNKHKILAAGFSAMLFSIPLQSHADEDLVDYGTGFTISAIGVGTGANGTAFFDLVEQPAASKGCTWERYYINLDTPAGVSTYATLLNVYNRGKKLRRLHFFQTSNPGGCTVNLIELKV